MATALCKKTIQGMKAGKSTDTIVTMINTALGVDRDREGMLTLIGQLAAEAKQLYRDHLDAEDEQEGDTEDRASQATRTLDVIVALCLGPKPRKRILRPG